MLPRIFHHRPRISFVRLHSQAATAAAVLTNSITPEPAQVPHIHQQSQKCIREQLRELLRETAQPVAVITAFMPPSSLHNTGNSTSNTQILHHGATLSSFTSIAMDPYPLVTFALRIPSRMANTLNMNAASASLAPANTRPAQMVINILSSTQAKHARVFSRPDLYPTPFTDPDIAYTISGEGLPVLEGSLGAMSCRLVGRGLPLHDLEFMENPEEPGADYYFKNNDNFGVETIAEPKRPMPLRKGALASELFIAQAKVHFMSPLRSRRTPIITLHNVIDVIQHYTFCYSIQPPQTVFQLCIHCPSAFLSHTFFFHTFAPSSMRFMDEKTSRRSSLTHFFSSAHHNHQGHGIRKRAQSLHIPSTRSHSILLPDSSHERQTNTLDRKSILKLSISAPLSASAPGRPFLHDAGSASSSTARTSFIEARHYEDPPSSSERKVQFVEPISPPHHTRIGTSHSKKSSSPSRIHRTRKRTVARVSISTGKLYYVQEPIPEYPFPSTHSPPPPSSSHVRFSTFLYRASYHQYHHITRAGVCPHLRGSDASRVTHLDRSPGCSTLMRRWRQSSGTPIGSSDSHDHDYEHPPTESPLYTSASEKFHAHWGTFAFNMRFSMFRVQDRMKDSMARVGGVVRRIKLGSH